MAHHRLELTRNPAMLERIAGGVPLPLTAHVTGASRCALCGCIESVRGTGFEDYSFRINRWLGREGLMCTGTGRCPGSD